MYQYHGSATVNVHVHEDGFITVIRTRSMEQADGSFECNIDYPFEDDNNEAELGDILNYFGHHYGRNEVEYNADDPAGKSVLKPWTVYRFKRIVESNA
jgi:hypothetical protein